MSGLLSSLSSIILALSLSLLRLGISQLLGCLHLISLVVLSGGIISLLRFSNLLISFGLGLLLSLLIRLRLIRSGLSILGVLISISLVGIGLSLSLDSSISLTLSSVNFLLRGVYLSLSLSYLLWRSCIRHGIIISLLSSILIGLSLILLCLGCVCRTLRVRNTLGGIILGGLRLINFYLSSVLISLSLVLGGLSSLLRLSVPISLRLGIGNLLIGRRLRSLRSRSWGRGQSRCRCLLSRCRSRLLILSDLLKLFNSLLNSHRLNTLGLSLLLHILSLSPFNALNIISKRRRHHHGSRCNHCHRRNGGLLEIMRHNSPLITTSTHHTSERCWPQNQ